MEGESKHRAIQGLGANSSLTLESSMRSLESRIPTCVCKMLMIVPTAVDLFSSY